MTNKMLMNGAISTDAGHEEFRVALLKGQNLYNLYIDRPGYEQKKSNIYKGKITRIEPSLEAVFVDYGAERHGFLPFKEIAEIYFKTTEETAGSTAMRDLLHEGQELMVQVDKEERGNKGAALTTFISLAGCYLVLMPNNPNAAGISRRIEGEDREELREVLSALSIPADMGVIVRTAGVGKSLEELRWDLSTLLKLWEAIQEAYQSRPAPFLIHQESDIVVRAIRDYLREDIDEILVDNHDVFVKVQQHIQQIRPDFANRVKLYQSNVPLFSRFQIESQIEAAFQHEVRLPSGGVIVIDHTEALVSIDINSSRSTRGGDIEETALHTNLEAAEEIARQLRIRDIGGLIVIDFIDMSSARNQREVEERLRHALEADRARVQIGRISRFGLLEMSRQRLRASLGEATQNTCPRCHGHGSVRSVPSLALSILRLIEEEALKENTREVRAQLPIDIATFLLNEKRDAIVQIETRHEVCILVIPNHLLETPNYKIDRIRASDTSQKEGISSYQISYTPETEDILSHDRKEKRAVEQPAIKTMPSIEPHPVNIQSTKSKPGLIKRIISGLFGTPISEEEPTEKIAPVAAPTPSHKRGPNKQRRGGGRFAGHHHRTERTERPERNEKKKRFQPHSAKQRPTSSEESTTHMHIPETKIISEEVTTPSQHINKTITHKHEVEIPTSSPVQITSDVAVAEPSITESSLTSGGEEARESEAGETTGPRSRFAGRRRRRRHLRAHGGNRHRQSSPSTTQETREEFAETKSDDEGNK